MFDKIVGGILSPIFRIIDKAVPDRNLAISLKADIEKAVIANKGELMKTMREIAVAEVKGNLYQSSWRPTLAYLLIFLLAWAFVLVPVSNALGFPVEAPDTQSITMIAGLFSAVYGLGRSFEKSGSKIVVGGQK